MSPMIEITTTQRRALRAAAHALKPVVSISQKGLTESVLKEIDRCLTSHELIKVRVYDTEREQREVLFAAVCEATQSAQVQHIGNLLVLWRERAEEPTVAGSHKPGALKKSGPRLTKKAAAAKTDKAARARTISQGKPRRPTRGN
jgi:RNA-binding protein